MTRAAGAYRAIVTSLPLRRRTAAAMRHTTTCGLRPWSRACPAKRRRCSIRLSGTKPALGGAWPMHVSTTVRDKKSGQSSPGRARHQSRETKKGPQLRALTSKRLMGLEPTTFCMASSASAEASESETARNPALRLEFHARSSPCAASAWGPNPESFVPLLCQGGGTLGGAPEPPVPTAHKALNLGDLVRLGGDSAC
jgi:hypothetical protein